MVTKRDSNGGFVTLYGLREPPDPPPSQPAGPDAHRPPRQRRVDAIAAAGPRQPLSRALERRNPLVVNLRGRLAVLDPPALAARDPLERVRVPAPSQRRRGQLPGGPDRSDRAVE